MALLTAEFDCEVLTPMFLSGVDQRACELRAPSVRGAMRMWYRALLGGQGVTDIRELKRREAAVFGTTDTASPVAVRVLSPPGLQLGNAVSLPDWESSDPDHPKMGSPTRYLWYSAKLGTNDRKWIPPGTTFRVVIQTVAAAKRADEHRTALEDALDAFWLVAHLGSLGTRARRAAGSFTVRRVHQEGAFRIPPFRADGAFDVPTVASHLAHLVPAPSDASPDFSILGSQGGVWRAGWDETHWEDAVWNAGAALRSFRLRLGLDQGPKDNPAPTGFPDDYTTMKRAVERNTVPAGPVGRASFGLPLTFRFSSSPKSKKEIKPAQSDRRASPLWIRIVRLPGGGYDAVLTHLAGRLVPGALAVRGQQGTFPPPADSLVPAFIRSLERPAPLFP